MARPPLLWAAAIVTALAVGASSGRAGAQTPATVNITVDATTPGAAIERIWPFHGYDEVNYTTTPDGRALLGTLATLHTAPVHIRSHFLLNTGNGVASLKWGSTNIYTEDASGSPIYNFTIIDGIMDAVTGAGAAPYAEIAFMPQAMTSAPAGVPYQNTGIYTLDGGAFYPPKDYTKWGALIRAWAMHVKTRYPGSDSGAESAWQWELWNEPDIGYWNSANKQADFNKLYDYTESALHAVSPMAPLGGPSVAAPGAFLTQFLQHCATGTNAVSGQTGTRLDSISFHAKGGAAIVNGHVEMNLGNQLVLHRNGFNEIAAVAQFKQTPIVVSEADPDGCAACPVSMTPADAYRNSPAYGAYEIAMMKKTLELEARVGVKVRGLLTWAFTFPGTPYFAGYRALTTNGIHLPVLNDFKLLGQMDGARLPVTSTGALTIDQIMATSVRGTQADVDAMATLNGRAIQILVWNYHDDLVTVPDSPVHLSVKIPASFGSQVVANHMRVDANHGDAYTVWVGQGSPAAPSATQIAALQAAMQPAPLGADQTLAVTGGSVALDFTLPRHGVSLVTLRAPPGPDASAGDATTTADALAGAGGTGSGGGAAGGGGGASPAGGASGSAGTTGAGGASAGAGGSGGTVTPPKSNSGCSCGLAASAPPSTVILAILLVGVSLLSRRR
jgi:xylan 1,4-beta-xylosidase